MEHALFVAGTGEHDEARCAAFLNRRWQQDETFTSEREFHAMSRGKFKEFMAQLRPVLDSRQVLFAETGGETVGSRSARGRNIGQALAASLYRRHEELRLRGAAYHLVNDAERASRALAESFGAEGHVLYAVYGKPLWHARGLHVADGDGRSVSAGLLGRGAEVAERRVGDAVRVEVERRGVVRLEAFQEGL